MKVALLLRGHVRDSLFSNDLHDFVKRLYDLYSVDLFIHTWNVVSSGGGHREIRENLTPVTDLVLQNYLTEEEKHKHSARHEGDSAGELKMELF